MSELQFSAVIWVLGTAGTLIIILLSVIAYFVKGTMRLNEIRWAKQDNINEKISEEVIQHTEYIRIHERAEEKQDAQLFKLEESSQEMRLVLANIQARVGKR